MIPETIGAFLAFLGLVVPGLVFTLLRERHIPAEDTSAFREASIAGVTSLAFTILALATIYLAAQAWPDRFAFPDLSDWFARGSAYAAGNAQLVVTALIATVGIAVVYAIVAYYVLIGARHPSRLGGGTVSWHVLRSQRPRGYTPWLGVGLDDGTTIFGFLNKYDADVPIKDADVALWGPDLAIHRQESVSGTQASEGTQAQPPASGQPRGVEVTNWDVYNSVIIPGARIRHIRLRYEPKVDTDSGRRRWRRARRPTTAPSEEQATPPAADTSLPAGVQGPAA